MYDRKNVTEGACERQERAYSEQKSGRLGSVSVSSLPPERGEIATVLGIQEKSTHELLATIEALAQKLQPALIPTPACEASGADKAGYGSQIATCVARNTDDVRLAIARLLSLMSELAI